MFSSSILTETSRGVVGILSLLSFLMGVRNVNGVSGLGIPAGVLVGVLW